MFSFLSQLLRKTDESKPADTVDEGYYATQFVSQHGETLLFMPWQRRAPDLNAQPYDASLGVLALVNVLGQDHALSGLQPDQLRMLGGYFDYVHVEPGKQVIGQDEQSDYVLVVLQGSLAETRLQPSGARVRLSEGRTGDVLGDLTDFEGDGRLSSWTVLTPAILAVLDQEAVNRLLIDDPLLAAALLRWLGRQVSKRLRQAKARLSAQLTRQE